LLRDLPDRLRRRAADGGGYVLLTGPQGMGKSALTARLSEALNPSGDALGPDRIRTQDDAPWLPGALLHMGKQSKVPVEIVQLLLA